MGLCGSRVPCQNPRKDLDVTSSYHAAGPLGLPPRCCTYPTWSRICRRPSQALFSIVGFSMRGMRLGGLAREVLSTLLRGAPDNRTTSPYSGDPVVPAANLAYLDLSGRWAGAWGRVMQQSGVDGNATHSAWCVPHCWM